MSVFAWRNVAALSSSGTLLYTCIALIGAGGESGHATAGSRRSIACRARNSSCA